MESALSVLSAAVNPGRFVMPQLDAKLFRVNHAVSAAENATRADAIAGVKYLNSMR